MYLVGMVILLHGEMGAGKTYYVKEQVKKMLGRDIATSPTFSIINQYAPHIFHADLYRIKNQNELLNTDFFEILHDPENTFFIEWPYNNVDKSIYKGIKCRHVHIKPFAN